MHLTEKHFPGPRWKLMPSGFGIICRIVGDPLMPSRRLSGTGRVNARSTRTDHSGLISRIPPGAASGSRSGLPGRKNMVYGARVRGSRSKTMTITRLADSSLRLNIMITNADTDIMVKLPGTITKGTIINGAIGKRPWIPRMFWLLRITGSMSAPEPTTPDPDHRTH